MTEFLKKVTKADIRNILALVVVIGCFILLYIMQVKAIPVENKDMINIAVGFVFGGALAGVIGYYFGGNKVDTPKTDDDK